MVEDVYLVMTHEPWEQAEKAPERAPDRMPGRALAADGETEEAGAGGQQVWVNPPAQAVIVHAATFLHPDLPQPDAGRIYRCLTEFPGRTPGCLIPLSTLDYELDGGRLWPAIADRDAVLTALLTFARAKDRFDSIPLPLWPGWRAMLDAGPDINIPAMEMEGPDAGKLVTIGPRDRALVIGSLSNHLPENSGRRRLWPGDRLTEPPAEPAVMPYRPGVS